MVVLDVSVNRPCQAFISTRSRWYLVPLARPFTSLSLESKQVFSWWTPLLSSSLVWRLYQLRTSSTGEVDHVNSCCILPTTWKVKICRRYRGPSVIKFVISKVTPTCDVENQWITQPYQRFVSTFTAYQKKTSQKLLHCPHNIVS